MGRKTREIGVQQLAGKEFIVLHSVTLALKFTHNEGKTIPLLDSEDGVAKPLRNVCNYLTADTNQVLDDLK
jgi:hypothetical protein